VRYCLRVDFTSDSDEEARKTLAEASRIIKGSCFRLDNLDRWAMFKQCLGWGSVIGITFAAVALYFISEGWWTR
jgi:hypothetical protein